MAGIFPEVVVVRLDGWDGGVIMRILVNTRTSVDVACMEGLVELVEAHPLVLPVEIVQSFLFVKVVLEIVGEETCCLGWRHHTKDEGAVGPRECPVVARCISISDSSTKQMGNHKAALPGLHHLHDGLPSCHVHDVINDDPWGELPPILVPLVP